MFRTVVRVITRNNDLGILWVYSGYGIESSKRKNY